MGSGTWSRTSSRYRRCRWENPIQCLCYTICAPGASATKHTSARADSDATTTASGRASNGVSASGRASGHTCFPADLCSGHAADGANGGTCPHHLGSGGRISPAYGGVPFRQSLTVAG